MRWLQQKLLNYRVNRWAKQRQRVFNSHLITLTQEEQRQLGEGSHPSQSHDHTEIAQPFTDLLVIELSDRGFTAKVELGFYHLNRLVLSADLARPPKSTKSLPRFFRGFEVKYHWPGLTS